MIIPQIPFFGLDANQIDVKWVNEGYGLEANIFDGNSFDDENFLNNFSKVLSYAKSLKPSLLTLHFPTENGDYMKSKRIEKKLYEFIEMAIKYEVSGITLHTNQFLSIDEYQKYALDDKRKKICEFLAHLDENLKEVPLWIGIENLPMIGNLGEDFDPIFVYPQDFKELTKLGLRNVGITWDLCHWSITFLTHLSISKLFRDKKINLDSYLSFINLNSYIKHYHFSSFLNLTIPYSGVKCYEGQHPKNGLISEDLLKQAIIEINKNSINKIIGMTFEVIEQSYLNRITSWEVLKWFVDIVSEKNAI